MKRLLAVLAGGLGLGAILKRRSRPAPAGPSPAEELRAKLDHAKAQDAKPESVDDRRADVHAKARQAIDDLGAP